MILPKNEKIVIVGAGCFGVSTAYHLLQRGYTDVTIIDRSTTLPAPDAASNDINRIVRSSYADKFYAELARDAISLWKDHKKWGNTYQESGVIVLGSSDLGETYTDESYKNDIALGAVVEPLNDGDAIRSAFPAQVPTAAFDQCSGYLNRTGGWANAGQGTSLLTDEVKALKGKFISGQVVSKILRENGRTTGVQCNDGTVFNAALVIIAAGSWTPSAFPELDLGVFVLPRVNCPVVLDFSSGFYIFPPNERNVVKMAIHSAGYAHFDEANATNVYPDLAEKPFIGTRLCWYNDSPDGDWVIGHYPKDDSLILATGDSGHAFKFLPVIGRLVADLVEDKLDPELVAKFAVGRKTSKVDSSRSGQVLTLDLNGLYGPADLHPGTFA
ncbi:FAD dependent oxidoreductase [Flammula alnicola]|nr:FAD dependent oxidoreductase [Flammula alnicola]